MLIRTPIDQDAYADKYETDDKPNQRQRNHEAKPLYVRNAAGSQYGHQHTGSRIDTVYDAFSEHDRFNRDLSRDAHQIGKRRQDRNKYDRLPEPDEIRK